MTGFAWLNPIYLAGLLLLALPVLIHLVQKHHPGGLRFPSLMFLQKIPYQQKRRLEIRHWLLLLLRCLLLALLAFAFARPFFSTGAADAGVSRDDTVIVIDRSYSMRLADRWRQAQAAALGALGRAGAEDRFGLLLFDDEALVLAGLDSERGELRALIENQQPGLRGTRPRLALEQAARLLAASDAARKRILLISDFEAPPGEPVPRIASDIEVSALPIASAASANLAISGFRLGPSARSAAGDFALGVELSNHATEALATRLGVSLNGRELDSRQLRLEGGERLSIEFGDLSFAGDLARGVIRIDDDALALDNRAYFVYSSRQRVPVLLIEAADARPNQSLYIENALRLSRQPVYRVTRARWEQLQPRDLFAQALVIVNDAPLPGGAQATALRDFVAGGGGLLVAVGEALQGGWPAGDGGYLPGTLLRRVDAAPGRAARITEITAAPPLAGIDLSRASIFSYRELRARPGDRVLAAYADGAAALLERQLGEGRALVLTTTLDTHWNDLVLRPVFVPFLHRSLNYLAAFEPYANSVSVGDVVDVLRHARAFAGSDAVVAAAGDASLTIETPGAGEIRLARDNPLLPIGEPGFYQVHRATPSATEVVLAANIDPAEAARPALDAARFVREVEEAALAPAARAAPGQRQAQESERRQQLWYAILSLALILMLLEAFGANWLAVKSSRGS